MRIANKLPLLIAACMVIWLIACNGFYLYATLFDEKPCSEIVSQLKSNDGVLPDDTTHADEQKISLTEVNSHSVLSIFDKVNSQMYAGSTYPAILIVIVLFQIILIILFIKSNRRREKSASELRRSREMFTQVFNRSPAYKMIVEGESGKIINANNIFIELAGVDVIGKTILFYKYILISLIFSRVSCLPSEG
ncbi:MAG: hypothetical protein PF637_07905 [Spirochaetes bacterium]|jgi:hypothetical protein|nr:hypothetical protein [Spirochaetota bacterium]